MHEYKFNRVVRFVCRNARSRLVLQQRAVRGILQGSSYASVRDPSNTNLDSFVLCSEVRLRWIGESVGRSFDGIRDELPDIPVAHLDLDEGITV
jgi:hypothetical protein